MLGRLCRGLWHTPTTARRPKGSVADHVWLLGEIARFAGYGRFESVRRAEQHRKQERMGHIGHPGKEAAEAQRASLVALSENISGSQHSTPCEVNTTSKRPSSREGRAATSLSNIDGGTQMGTS